MQRIDDTAYRKYFSMRRKTSKRSEKNKALAKSLEERGLMTDFGREKMEEAQKTASGTMQNPQRLQKNKLPACLTALLNGLESAFTNFQAMPPPVKKTYTRAYLDAKTDAGREKRIAWIVDRLHKNMKPM